MGRDFCRPLQPLHRCLNSNCSNVVYYNIENGRKIYAFYCNPCQTKSDKETAAIKPGNNGVNPKAKVVDRVKYEAKKKLREETVKNPNNINKHKTP